MIVVIDGVNYDITTWRDSTDTWGTTTTDAQIATRTPPDGGAAQQALNGSVDEVAVWLNRQLTVEEAIGLYQAALGISPPLAGDYNNDGTVNTQDYDKWKTDFNSTTSLDADGNNNDIVDVADYTIWRDNLGAVNAAASAGGVPEPATWFLLLIGSGALRAVRRKPR